MNIYPVGTHIIVERDVANGGLEVLAGRVVTVPSMLPSAAPDVRAGDKIFFTKVLWRLPDSENTVIVSLDDVVAREERPTPKAEVPILPPDTWSSSSERPRAIDGAAGRELDALGSR